MPQWILNVKDFPRRNRFPFRVEKIYYCRDMLIPAERWRKQSSFEMCLRLPANADFTEDVVDGKLLKLSCPNVVWRMPGSVWGLPRPDIRNSISFNYALEVPEKLELLDMKVEELGWSFAMTSELEALIAKFHRTIDNLYTPGMADVLDWVCFSLMGTMRLQENRPRAVQTVENRIRNISLWFQTHFAEKIDLDEVAAANGMSRDHFYKSWKKSFDTPPAQYINHLRLEAAARRLRETDIAIAEICREVHFAGEYMFYKCFRREFGMTPAEYRARTAGNDAPPAN